jgi:hypothetical protein
MHHIFPVSLPCNWHGGVGSVLVVETSVAAGDSSSFVVAATVVVGGDQTGSRLPFNTVV